MTTAKKGNSSPRRTQRDFASSCYIRNVASRPPGGAPHLSDPYRMPQNGGPDNVTVKSHANKPWSMRERGYEDVTHWHQG